MAIKENEKTHFPEFIRHVQLGPGRVLDQKAQRIIVQFRNPNGELEDNTYQYDLSDWKIREIPRDSLGAVFFQEPAKVFLLIDAHDPQIVELCLKELKDCTVRAGGTNIKLDCGRRINWKNCLRNVMVVHSRICLVQCGPGNEAET